MTLPLIFALHQADWFTKRRIINTIKNDSENPKKVAEVIDFVKKSGGIEYATQVMKSYVDEALTILSEFPDNAYRNSLQSLVQYTIERVK